MAQGSTLVNYIAQGARARGLDPRAVLAVASVEGLGGGVGDQGTSFGPFQMHLGGAFPRGVGGNRQAWATSPAGINYALDRIAGVARGLHGRQAVSAIVSRFERPADIPGEINRASARYGGKIGGGAVMARAPYAAGAPSAAPNRNLLALQLINQGNEMFGLDPLPTVTPITVPRVRPQTPVTGNVRAGGPGPAPTRGRSLNWIEHFASPFGLTVTSTTTGNHVKNSYHYKGRAVDFGGNPARMARLARYALQHAGQITEMFYTGPGNPGFFIKNGRVYPNSQLDRGLYAEHTNHVHLAR